MRVRGQNVAVWIGIAIVVLVVGIANRHVFFSSSNRLAQKAKLIPTPRSFPRNYPIYPGATYVGSNEEEEQVNGKWYDRAWFHVSESSDKVIAWYDTHLPRAGYKPLTTRIRSYSKLYGFALGTNVLQMDIFIAHHGPTDYSIDIPSSSA